MQSFRDSHPEHDTKVLDKEKTKWTYMGRLDPLADGVLLLANKEDVKRKEEFLELDKEYDFVAVLGFETDTYDVLGKIQNSKFKIEDLAINELNLKKLCDLYIGTQIQKYPPFSSKTINGKALHELARNDLLMEEDLPEREVTIHSLKFQKIQTLNTKEFFGRLLMDIGRVKGDFRQNQILVLWRKVLFGSYGLTHNLSPKERAGGSENYNIVLAHFSAHVSSGTYIRTLVKKMGDTLGCGATVLSITRTRVGGFDIKDSIK